VVDCDGSRPEVSEINASVSNLRGSDQPSRFDRLERFSISMQNPETVSEKPFQSLRESIWKNRSRSMLQMKNWGEFPLDRG